MLNDLVDALETTYIQIGMSLSWTIQMLTITNHAVPSAYGEENSITRAGRCDREKDHAYSKSESHYRR